MEIAQSHSPADIASAERPPRHLLHLHFGRPDVPQALLISNDLSTDLDINSDVACTDRLSYDLLVLIMLSRPIDVVATAHAAGGRVMSAILGWTSTLYVEAFQ